MTITVKAVRSLKLTEPVPVYDATVPIYHNFALANGVVVHNTAKYARYKEYQEVLKLKGKPLNSARVSIAKMTTNESINNILVAIGYKPAPDGTHKAETSARVQHVYLLADADPDGQHINVLGLTALWKALPQLFFEHRVRVVIAPLYCAYYKGEQYFADTLDEIKAKLPPKAPAKVITRLKGWGEASADELREIAFNPQTRKAYIIHPPKSSDEDASFYAVVGEDTTKRKQLLGL